MKKLMITVVCLMALEASADWHYRPYEYETWMLQQMRAENSRGILHFGYPGVQPTLATEPDAFYCEGDVEGFESIPGEPSVMPHRVMRAEHPVRVKHVIGTKPGEDGKVDDYYDLGHEDIGYVRVQCDREPRLFVGESLAEMRNSDTNAFEQSTRMILEANGLWRSDIPLALRYFRFEGKVSSVSFSSQLEKPFVMGAFNSGDKRMDKAWSIGVETLRCCTRTFLLDAIKRDRLPWAGDLVLSLLAQSYAYGNPEPVKRSLAVLGAFDPAKGAVNGILAYSMWWIVAQDLFQLHFGDMPYLKLHYPRIRARVEELATHEDEKGFASRDLGWNFMDWTDRKGGELKSPITLQCIYYAALQAGVRLARRMNDNASEQKWRVRAERLRRAILAAGMDETRHSRIMAIFGGVVSGDMARQYAREIAADDMKPTVTPYMSAFEVMVLLRCGEKEAALRKYESVWGKMVDAGVQTFWEGWDDADKGDEVYEYYGRPFGKSLCHVWSAGPVFLFPMCFMGVEPVEDGWSRFKVEPSFPMFTPDMTNVSVRVWTPKGRIRVAFSNGKPFVELGCDRLVRGDGNAVPCRQLGILTPPESAAPRINGPKVFGVSVGKPLNFYVPVTGRSPIRLSLSGDLPDGVRFDPVKRMLTGRSSKAGEHRILFTAENAAGRVSREFTLKVGKGICLTPPLGWNSWNCWGWWVTDEKMRRSADAMVSTGLRDHGWTYIVVDDCWRTRPTEKEAGFPCPDWFVDHPFLYGPARKSDGTPISNVFFPDMKGMADYIHAKGLKAGLYSVPSATACCYTHGSWQNEAKDAETWCAWGYDLIKYDWCYGGRHFPGRGTRREWQIDRFSLMGRLLAAQPRDMVYNVCNYGMEGVREWARSAGGHYWRTNGDLVDEWPSLIKTIDANLEGGEAAGPGGWNDPDMLVVGSMRMNNFTTSHLTPNEQYAHISFWTMLSAPLFIGCDLENLDPFTRSLLTNDEIIEINQDELGSTARTVVRTPVCNVWLRSLANGDWAICLFNRTLEEREIVADFAALGLSAACRVRDVWAQKDLGRFEGRFAASIPPHAALVYRLAK